MNRNLKLKISLILLLMSWLTPLIVFAESGQIGQANYLSPLEKEVVQEVNLARTSPKSYASFLEQLKTYYKGKILNLPGETPVLTQEGVVAVTEAIGFLRSLNPISPLDPSKGMSLGAKDHVRDLKWSGNSQHRGSDKSQPWERVNRYGTWQKGIGENIAFGNDKARNIVMALIIDDGVPHRGHRKNIFNSNFRVMGVACGEHPHYQTVCVITFAGGYIEREKR